MARAFEEAFVGYAKDPVAILQKSFDEIDGYDEMVALRGIRFESLCEHHMAPILGARGWLTSLMAAWSGSASSPALSKPMRNAYRSKKS